MARSKRGRAFELDGVRYLGSPPPQAALRVKFVDMREIGSGPLGSAELTSEEKTPPASEEGITGYARASTVERSGRRAALPAFNPSDSIVAPEPEGESGQE